MASARPQQKLPNEAVSKRSLTFWERAWISLGCDPSFISDTLGDLREECAERSAQQGKFVALWWYVLEMVRSSPHIIWNAISNGSPLARARFTAYTAAGIISVSLIIGAWLARNGPPARLVASEAYSDGIVINNLGPVRLSVGVVDAAGHALSHNAVRYRRVSGNGILVSSEGMVKCTHRGDALVRASVAGLSRDLVVHCDPIKEIRDAGWGNFLVGQPARALTIDALGVDGQPVTRVAARLRVEDSTVATIEGGELRPLRAGFTGVDMNIGDVSTGTLVTVFERVATFEDLRPEQSFVVAPIHLTRGQRLRWPLPVGDFFIAFGSDSTELPTPRAFGYSVTGYSKVDMTAAGPIMCIPDLQPGVLNTHCLARGPGATLTIAHPGGNAPEDVVGMLALERWHQPIMAVPKTK